ncbi:TetR/AcrR family transcriptional regulator [Lacticaseibacillus thailandensis]|uniref:TetR/AcrR family transcriptional regulator n=1 Tax=Lacticaseibacillus thailandensis TaxID=381741 RepID=UPI0009E90D20
MILREGGRPCAETNISAATSGETSPHDAAAKTEFTRAVFAKASISNIIELAGVPRGSFYQYFEDKQDIFLLFTRNGGATVR